MSQLPHFEFIFLSCQQQKKHPENGAAVTSLRSFLFRDDFTIRGHLHYVNIFQHHLPPLSCLVNIVCERPHVSVSVAPWAGDITNFSFYYKRPTGCWSLS